MKKRWVKGLLPLLCLLLTASCTGNGAAPNGTDSTSVESTGTSGENVALPDLTVTVISIGKADAILVETEGHSLLIDTGEDEDGEKVAAVLEDRGIRRLEYLVITHLDKDHIGGVDHILPQVEVGRVIQSCNTEDSGQYEEYEEACREAGIVPERLTDPLSLSLGGAELKLLPAARCDYEDDNDYSILTEMTYGRCRFLFAGDAEDERLEEYLSREEVDTVDFLKVPHHGRLSHLSEELIEAVSPRYAVITCSKKNPPDEELLELLEQNGAQVFLTTDGSVRTVCDGLSLRVVRA